MNFNFGLASCPRQTRFRRAGLFLGGLAALHTAGRLTFLGDLAPLADRRVFDAGDMMLMYGSTIFTILIAQQRLKTNGSGMRCGSFPAKRPLWRGWRPAEP